MSKKTLTLITGLIIVVAILIVISVTQKNALEQPLNTVNTSVSTSPTVAVPKNSTLSLSPSTISASPNTPQQVSVTIDSTNDVSAVQLELSFDPQKLSNVDIVLPKTGGFFENPTVLLKNIDRENGKISFAFGISPTQNSKTGTGTVAVLSFTPKLTLGEQTKITFQPKTLVTALGVFQSVLKNTSDATISGTQ